MAMKTWDFEVKFNTPAFSGDADQCGRWRTPPFKALLRQWWRVQYAAQHGSVNIASMRKEEGLLFGHASPNDETNARQSLLRLRLDSWRKGAMQDYGQDSPVRHPEVGQNGMNVGAGLYLGYGPLTSGQRQTLIRTNAAIQAGDSARLSVAVPDDYADAMQQVFRLLDLYGTVGGRSRNGWGSFSLRPLSMEKQVHQNPATLRVWADCLKLDWPHALGKDKDNQPLIWQTASAPDWRTLMQKLAAIKIGLRTHFRFTLNHAGGDRPGRRGINHGRPQARHWLSYPVTNHEIRNWGSFRLPNTLRFKIRPTADGQQFVATIFHMPHLPPAGFEPDKQVIQQVWQDVYQFLDKQPTLNRSPE